MTWRIVTGNCLSTLEGLETLGDLSVDHALFDGPYSQHVHENSRRGTKKGRQAEVRDLGFSFMTEALRESVAFHLARVVRRWVIAFSDFESVHLWKAAFERYGLEWIRCGVWEKPGATPQKTGDRPAQGDEALCIAHRPGKKSWNGGGSPAHWRVPVVRGEERGEHTTQKPVELMERLVMAFTDHGETVLDPFAGEGSTAVACVRNGRHFVGWELDAATAGRARSRVTVVHEQIPLFKKRPSKFQQLPLVNSRQAAPSPEAESAAEPPPSIDDAVPAAPEEEPATPTKNGEVVDRPLAAGETLDLPLPQAVLPPVHLRGEMMTSLLVKPHPRTRLSDKITGDCGVCGAPRSPTYEEVGARCSDHLYQEVGSL